MARDRDELFGMLCVQQGYLTPEQVAEAQEARRAAAGLGMALSLPDVVLSKNLLSREHRDEVMRILSVQTGEARVVGGYEVVAKLGEGGMGVVYKARNTSSGEFVALKVLPPSLAREGTLLKRFRREAELTRTLEHESIVRCVEIGFDRERKLHFCALELIEGEDLGKRITRHGKVPVPEALEITRQIARAVDHANSQGLVHRDIKPQNIMLTPSGMSKLLDLGLARSVAGQDTRLTQTGMFAGSPHYASPEQARGERRIDVRSDIYSLGATLYHMLTGRTPFSGDSPAAVLAKVLNGRLAWPTETDPGIPEDVCRVIAKMMARDADDRYQTPAELIHDLSLLMAGREPVGAELAHGESMMVRAGERAGRGTQSHRAVAAPAGSGSKTAFIAGVLGVAGVAVLAFLFFAGDEEPEPSAPPETQAAPVVPARPSGETSGVDADRERKLSEMLDFAKKHVSESPAQFERAIRYFERVRDEGRGTRFELMADSEIEDVRKRWREAAHAALASAAEKARQLAASGDVDAALGEIRALPADVAPQVEAEARDEAARIVDAARSRAEGVFAEAEDLLSGGDTDGALAALAELGKLRFEQGKAAIALRQRVLEGRILEAEKAKAAEEEARAGEVLPRLLAEFDDLLRKGDFAGARERMKRAAADEANARVAGTLEAAARVAAVLRDRRKTMTRAAEGLVGRNVTLRTAGGIKKGEVEKAGDDGIALVAKVIINKQVRGVTRFTVPWADLVPKEEDKLAKEWDPPPPDGAVARALIAAGREDADEAEQVLSLAGAHPLVGFVRERIYALRTAEVDAAAEDAWREIERRAGSGEVDKLGEAKAKDLLAEVNAFEQEFGGTRFAASRKDDISALRARAEQVAGRSGTVLGILTNKGDDWIEVKADEDGLERRYTPLVDSAGRPDAGTKKAISGLVSPNRVSLTWRLQGGHRRIVDVRMLPPGGDKGTVVGTVAAKSMQWIEVKPDDGPPERFMPRWVGGMPHEGGGFEKELLVALLTVNVGDRAKLDWVYDLRKRVVAVKRLPRAGKRPLPAIKEGVKFHDTFETGMHGWSVVRWSPQVIGDLSRTRAKGAVKEGRSALALKYTLEPGTLPLVMRPATDINHLTFWIRTVNRPADVVVGANEKDESRYHSWQHIEAADGWKRLDLDLATFTLADDSKDENGGLDFDQIANISVIDISAILGGRGENTLLIDDLVGEFRRAPGDRR
jgi:serine/threonine-protein kinase